MYIGFVLPRPREHVTLTFSGQDETIDQFIDAQVALQQAINTWHDLDLGKLSAKGVGLDRFMPSGAWVSKLEAPSLIGFRAILVDFLDACLVPYYKDFEFTPHVTLTYFPKRPKDPYKGLEFEIPELSVVSKTHGTRTFTI